MHKSILEKSVEKFLDKLDDFEAKKITKKLRELEYNPRLGAPLTANFAGLWKLRVGKYRIIYKIVNDQLIVLILDIGHRKNVYS